MLFGRNWKKVSAYVKTRTPFQVKAHAKRLESAMKRERHKKKEKVVYDHLTQKEVYTSRDYVFKIAHIGNTGVGRRALVARCAHNDFSGRVMDSLSVKFVLLII